MNITVLPLNSDNYGYLISAKDNDVNEAVVVDVSNQPEAVMDAAAALNIRISAVLTTHKHWDHAGGNTEMKSRIDGLQIFGSQVDEVEACTDKVVDGQVVSVAGMNVLCIETPGHTKGHMCYYIEHCGERAVFTGDTLFIGGCGKFFEGSGLEMYPSLYEKLGGLPKDTKVYVGHEYTLSNYKFALAVDPDNEDLKSEFTSACSKIENGLPTVPSSIGVELKTNPFLRADDLMGPDETCVSFLDRLRVAKNNFK